MATTQEKITALETEIAQITLAISHILSGGQSYQIISAAGAGTQRTVTMADIGKLYDERNTLKRELKILEASPATRIGIGF